MELLKIIIWTEHDEEFLVINHGVSPWPFTSAEASLDVDWKQTTVCARFCSFNNDKDQWFPYIIEHSLHLWRVVCCQDWRQLLLPDRRCCGAGSVGICLKSRKTGAWARIGILTQNTIYQGPRKHTQISLCTDSWLHERKKPKGFLTYCTHSTARPFCMYSVMHLISCSFSSSNWNSWNR